MKTNTVKPIAFYLPQYHQIPENDEWWGEGFTEWTNVKRAKPFFNGHEQPLEPLEYYDLSNNTVIHRQIEQAKKYNIFGFCFQYYWFNQKRLLEKPIENFLKDKSEKANFPFMLCWANENWTRKQDKHEEDILIEQNHSIDDHEKVAKDLVRYMKDERYIRASGKPVLILYRPDKIKYLAYLLVAIKDEARKEGIEGVHILTTNSFGKEFNKLDGLDGIVEFPPHFPVNSPVFQKVKANSGINEYPPTLNTTKTEHKGYIFDAEKTVDLMCRYYYQKKDLVDNYYPCCFPSWDNTAIKMEHSNIFANMNSEVFKKWLISASEFTKIVNKEDSQFVFINAWNKWAEGAMLESDKKNQNKNLEVVREVMNEYIQ